MADIPEPLKYLARALEKLKRFADEDLGDDNPEAMAIVEKAIRKRVHGMSAAEAMRTIKADADLLAGWIESSDTPVPSTAPYVHGVLMGITMFVGEEDMAPYTG